MSLIEKVKIRAEVIVKTFWFNVRYRVYPWKMIEGVRFPVQMSLNFWVLFFIDKGTYEGSEVGIIKKTLTKEDKVLELGTGMGFISTFCSKIIGSEKVYTFEANKAMQPAIEKMFAANNVKPTVTYKLLGDGDKNIKFYKKTDSFLASSVHKLDNTVEVVMEQQDLNSTIAKLQPTYLVMDIEGAEYEVFKLIDFQSIRKVQFELHPLLLKEDQIKAIFKKLADSGFTKDENLNYPDNFFFSRNA